VRALAAGSIWVAASLTSGCLACQDYGFVVAGDDAGSSREDGGNRTDSAVPDAEIESDSGVDAGPPGGDAGPCDVDGDGYPDDPARCGRPDLAADCDDGNASIAPWAAPTCGNDAQDSCPDVVPFPVAEIGDGAPMRLGDVGGLAPRGVLDPTGERQITLLLRPPPVLGAPGAQAAVLWHEDDGAVRTARIRTFDLGGTVQAPTDVRALAVAIDPTYATLLPTLIGARIGRIQDRALLGGVRADAAGFAHFFIDLDAELRVAGYNGTNPGEDRALQGFMSVGGSPAWVRSINRLNRLSAFTPTVEITLDDARVAQTSWITSAGRLTLGEADPPYLWDGRALASGGTIADTTLPTSSQRPGFAAIGDDYVGVMGDGSAGYAVFTLSCPSAASLASCAASTVSTARDEPGRHHFALTPIDGELAAVAFARPSAEGEEVAIGFVQRDGTWLEPSVHTLLAAGDVGDAFEVEDIAVAAETVRGVTTIVVAAVLEDVATGAFSLWARATSFCESDACVPLSCTDVSRSCGTFSDGCGGTPSCGDCSELDTECGAATCDAGSGACSVTPMNEGGACEGTDPLVDHVCRAGSCVPDRSPVRLNEVSGGTPDFIELVNTGSGPISLDGLVVEFTDDNGSASFAIPAGITVPANGVWRLVDSEATSLLSDESSLGSNRDWGGEHAYVALCQGTCATDCTNYIDYVDIDYGTEVLAVPACASFSPTPIAPAGNDVARVAFVGSGAAGLLSDWTERAGTRP
jgi:hypothetical protein